MWVDDVYQLHGEEFEDTGVLIDVGANIGSVSVWAASKGARVFAVEPQPDNLNLLRQNIADNLVDVTVCPWAVGAERGEAFISDRHGNSRLGSEGSRVPVVRLVDVFADNQIPACDVLKIDIEGSEYPLIEGADIKTLQKIRFLTMEFDAAPDQAFGAMIAKLAKVFNLHVIGSPERGGYCYGRRY
jgi:FkbM family methyltransferase